MSPSPRKMLLITLYAVINGMPAKHMVRYTRVSAMASCGVATTPEERQKATVNLIITMAKDRTHLGEKERHIAPIYRLRAFFNGEYKVKASLPVTYAEPKAPKAPAKKASPKGKKPEVKKIKNVSVDQWVKGLDDMQRDQLKVALACLEMDVA